MPVSFNKPPLLELIVELRWQTPGILVADTGNTPPDAAAGNYSHEQLFMHFGAAVSREGYSQFERTIPPGFPIPPFQVAYRFKPSPTDTAKRSTLFQLGNGVFTANALPPDYKTWGHFSPLIRNGIALLGQAFASMNVPAPRFDAAVVRYIDAFRGDLLGQSSTIDFITNVLGFKVDVPPAVKGVCSEENMLVPQLNFAFPSKVGQVQLLVAEGIVENARAIIFDTSVVIQESMNNDADEIIGKLTEARNVIHAIFLGITEPLHKAMEPIEVSE